MLQELGRYKTLIGLIIVEVASRLPFAVLIMRAFVASIPRQFVAVLTSGSAKGRSEAVREWTHRGDLERG